VAGAVWNLVAAIGCLIGAVICFVALLLSEPTFVNHLGALGTGIGALSCLAWVVAASIEVRRRVG
jgi:hypothetical protein